MTDANLIKGKVIADFKEELELKGFNKKTIYETSFLKILDHVGDYGAKTISSTISRFDTLTFHLRFDAMHVYLEWYPNRSKENTLLNITDLNDFEDGGTNYLTLEGALKKLDQKCKPKA